MPAYSVLAEIEKHRGVMTVTQVARIFSISRKTVYKLIQKGHIPTVQIGVPDAIRIDPASLAFKLRKDNRILDLAAKR